MKKRILVELDALLDTRIGSMNKFSPSLSSELVVDKGYYSRVSDDFDRYGAGTTMMWRNGYVSRDVDVLERSRPTLIPSILGELIRDIYAQSMDNPIWHGADVIVNVWPYNMLEAERLELGIVLRELIIPVEDDEYVFDTEFSTVSLSPEELTLDRIRENWEMVILYNFHDWYDAQAQGMVDATAGATQTNMFVPALFRETPNRKDLLLPDGGRLNPFDETRRWLSLYIQLNFWDSQLFSLPSPY